MSDEEVQHRHHRKSDEPSATATTKTEGYAAVDATDRGLLNFLGKKKKSTDQQGEVMASEFDEKVGDSEKKEEREDEEKKKKKQHEGLFVKLNRSSSSSSSSSDGEELREGGEKKKKKKGSKEKSCDQETEEKKGFLEKIKEKLPGGKKVEVMAASPPLTLSIAADGATPSGAEGKGKKGFFEKIKEKIPGYSCDEQKEKEN